MRRGLGSANGLKIAGVAAPLVSYSLMYLAYYQFYAPFGLRPRDVGLDRLRLLEESIFGLLLMPVAIAIAYPVALVSPTVLIGGYLAIKRHPQKNYANTKAWAKFVLVAYFFFSMLYGYGYIVVQAYSLGGSVYAEGKIVNSEVLGRTGKFLSIPILDIEAIPVQVISKEQNLATKRLEVVPTTIEHGPTLRTASQILAHNLDLQPACLLLLGQDKESYRIYDVRTERVTELKRDLAGVSTRPNSDNYEGGAVSPSCVTGRNNYVGKQPAAK